MTGSIHRVVLADLPTPLFDAAVGYLGDVLRECQLVLLGREQGVEVDPDLASLAEGLVPDLEELRGRFQAADIIGQDGHRTVAVDLRSTDAGTLAHLHVQLAQLRFISRRGGVLVGADPAVTQVLAWVRDEAAEQLNGRAARPFRAV